MYQDDLESSKAGFSAFLVSAARPAPIMVSLWSLVEMRYNGSCLLPAISLMSVGPWRRVQNLSCSDFFLHTARCTSMPNGAFINIIGTYT